MPSGRRVKMQVLSNSSIQHAGGGESAQQSQTSSEPTGCVSHFRANRDRRFQHCVGHDAKAMFVGVVMGVDATAGRYVVSRSDVPTATMNLVSSGRGMGS